MSRQVSGQVSRQVFGRVFGRVVGWIGVLAAVVLLGLAVWVLDRAENPRAPSQAESERTATAKLRGGIGVRGTDGLAGREPGASVVRASIVDLDGAPVREGTVVLTCWTPEDQLAAIPGGVVQIDTEGRIEGPGCRGRTCVQLQHPYLVAAEPWELEAGTDEVLTARMLPRLFGQVLDPHGTPVEAAGVAFLTPPEEEDPGLIVPLATHRTTTDADGTFSVAWLERPPCTVCQELHRGCDEAPLPWLDTLLIVVHAPGFAPWQRVIEATPGTGDGHDPDAPLVLRLTEGAEALSGTLYDGEGRMYPRAFVLARSAVRRHEQHRAEVVDGNFEFDGLGEGVYDLRALQDGVELARREGVSAGDDASLRGSVPAVGPDLRIVVVDAKHDPVAGVLVDGGPFSGGRTDGRGELRADQVLPGKLTLRLRPPGRAPLLHEVVVLAREAAPPGDRIQDVRVELAAPKG